MTLFVVTSDPVPVAIVTLAALLSFPTSYHVGEAPPAVTCHLPVSVMLFVLSRATTRAESVPGAVANPDDPCGCIVESVEPLTVCGAAPEMAVYVPAVLGLRSMPDLMNEDMVCPFSFL